MQTERYRMLYEALLEDGDLLTLFPELRRKDRENNWDIDKNKFIKLQEEQEKALNINVED